MYQSQRVLLKILLFLYIYCESRQKVYKNYAPLLINSKKLEIITEGEEQIIPLEKVNEVAEKMLKGQVKGRYVVQI